MNYLQIYDNIINNAITRDVLQEKYEIHHILPRCKGGTDISDNLVHLTLREHFICHLLLAKIYGGALYYAAFMMSSFKKYTSKQYAYIRTHLKQSPEHIAKRLKSTTGRKRTDETKQKQRLAKLGKPQSKEHIENRVKHNTGSKRSTETKLKMSKAQQGKILSEEHKQKLNDNHKGMSGKSFSEESKLKMSESQKNQPILECPHCKYTGKGNAMHRWHFNNCKSK